MKRLARCTGSGPAASRGIAGMWRRSLGQSAGWFRPASRRSVQQHLASLRALVQMRTGTIRVLWSVRRRRGNRVARGSSARLPAQRLRSPSHPISTRGSRRCVGRSRPSQPKLRHWCGLRVLRGFFLTHLAPCRAMKRSSRKSEMSWRVPPSSARSVRISPTTLQNL